MATDFNSYLGVKFKFDSAEARADIIKLLNDLDYFEKKLKNNFDTESIKRWTNSMDTAKQGLYEFGIQVDTVSQQSYQNFRAIGQMDRITREFASGGLTQGLNGLTMFGNSLTRLAVQEGGFKNAISSLAGAFTGPAGIVLGVSAAIGLFELYQKNVKKATDANLEFIKSLNDLNKKLYEIAGGSQAKLTTGSLYADIITDQSKDLNVRKGALESLKKLFSESAEIAKLDVNSKEFNNKQLLMYAVNRAAIQDFDINSQKNYETRLTQLYARRKELEDKRAKDLANVKQEYGANGVPIYNLDALRARINEQADAAISDINNKIKSAEDANKRLVNVISTLPTPSKGGKVKDYTSADELSKIERAIELTKQWANEEAKFFAQRRQFEKSNQAIQRADTSPAIFGDYLFAQQQKEEKRDRTPFADIAANPPKLPDWFNQYTSELNKNDEALKKEQQQYKQFAQTLTRDVTEGIMSVFDAMQKGQDPLEAIGNAFMHIAEQIAAVILEASILEAIMSAMPELKGAFAAVGVISGGGPKMFAEGGIVSQPTLGIFGEAGPEAVMPLSKLGNVVSNSFSAGAVSGGAGSGSAQFVLRGQDLLVALNRTQKSSALKGQNISLA
jgi:hypothetical protein